VRAATRPGIARLAQLGAREVVLPELEGGIEIVRSALLLLGLPTSDVQHYADSVRDGRYCPADAASATPGERVALDQLRLDQLMHASTAMDMSWLCLGPESPLVGQPLSAARPRTPRRARIIVIVRAGRVMPHPEPTLRLKVNDIIGVIGERADPSEDALAERREGELGGEQRGPIVRVEDRVDLDEIQT
jgi:CPA2 family monovalent cation:H+ antiporter-2